MERQNRAYLAVLMDGATTKHRILRVHQLARKEFSFPREAEKMFKIREMMRGIVGTNQEGEVNSRVLG